MVMVDVMVGVVMMATAGVANNNYHQLPVLPSHHKSWHCHRKITNKPPPSKRISIKSHRLQPRIIKSHSMLVIVSKETQSK